MTARLVYDADDEQATERLGAALAAVLPSGTIVALNGPLGAGKTRLVQAVARASDVRDQDVNSPTFVLVQEYHGTRPINHFDAYRLRDSDEFLELGPEEYFAQPALSFIEWAERVDDCLPPERLTIAIHIISRDARQFEISAEDAAMAATVEELRARLANSNPQG